MADSNMVMALARWVDKVSKEVVMKKLHSGEWNYATLDCSVGYFKVMLWKKKPEWNGDWNGGGKCEVGCEGHSVDIVEAEHTLWKLNGNEMRVVWKLDPKWNWNVEGHIVDDVICGVWMIINKDGEWKYER